MIPVFITVYLLVCFGFALGIWTKMKVVQHQFPRLERFGRLGASLLLGFAWPVFLPASIASMAYKIDKLYMQLPEDER